MTANNETNIKRLMDLHVPGTVLSASWLANKGFSYDLQQYYRKSGWLKSIGTGAFKRPNETVNWRGALYTLQQQLKLPVHPGGLTAITMLGASHYLRTSNSTVHLFTPLNIKLPAWFQDHDWSNDIQQYKTSFLLENVGLEQFKTNSFSLTIASAERAVLECLYLAPDKMDILECYQILSGLINLRPKRVQELLEKCSSIKVKRLFLYMAQKAGHQWFDFLNTSSITLGQGDRSLVKGGIYNKKYKITVPKELEQL